MEGVGRDAVVGGMYSVIVPFEVEHLIDETTVTTMFRKIATCEFVQLGHYLICWGKANPMAGLVREMRTILGDLVAGGVGEYYSPLTAITFDLSEMKYASNMFVMVKSINVVNPKSSDLRQVKLVGEVENMKSYDQIVDPENYGINNVTGVINLGIGPTVVTVRHDGSIKFGIKPGLMMRFDEVIKVYESITSLGNKQ